MLERFAKGAIADRFWPMLDPGDGGQMTMGSGKLLAGFEVIHLGTGAFFDGCFRSHRASLCSLLQSKVEGIAADIEESADVGFLLASVNRGNGFLSQVNTVGGGHGDRSILTSSKMS